MAVEDVIHSSRDIGRFVIAGSLDILLPEALLSDFQDVQSTRRSINLLFESLLGRYRHRVIRITRLEHDRLRKKYQRPGQRLHRISFRAEARVWTDLQLLSLSCHVSMSQIMVWLVVWEARRLRLTKALGWRIVCWDRVGTPAQTLLIMHKSEATGRLRLRSRFAAEHFLHHHPFYGSWRPRIP